MESWLALQAVEEKQEVRIERNIEIHEIRKTNSNDEKTLLCLDREENQTNTNKNKDNTAARREQG